MAISFAVVGLSLYASSFAAAETVVERYASGQVKAEYKTNDDGQKVGAYVEYYESGVVKTRANYRNDQLNGKFASYRPNKRLELRAMYRLGKLYGEHIEYSEAGKITRKAQYVDDKLHGEFVEHDEAGKVVRVAAYAAGKLHGLDRKFDGRKVVSQVLWRQGTLSLVWRDGEIELEGKTPSEIKHVLAEIRKADIKGPGTETMKKAVRRLMCYRFLCGVPHEGMELDKQMNLEAECAAKVCSGLGRLTHHPDRNPGLSKEVFELGKKGAARSNICGGGSVLASIDTYMHDSNKSNIGRVGHRRWLLNPAMLKLGLGRSGACSALCVNAGGIPWRWGGRRT
jgi:hypothetical protein